MRERIRQTYTSLEIGLMQEENEQLKRRLEKAIELLEPFVEIGNDVMFKGKMLEPVFEILKGEEII